MSVERKQGRVAGLLTPSSQVVATRGEGMYLYDQGGEKYLDFTSGIGVTSTGHCHPRVVVAAQRQAATLIHGQFTTVRHDRMVELTERLVELMPGAIDRVIYGNSGAEAIEGALRLVRHATSRTNVIVFQGSFHGRTTGALSMTTSSSKLRAGLQPLMGGVVVAPFPNAFRYGWDEATATDFCLRELDYILQTTSAPRETAAMFIEPVQGDGGYVPANTRFLQGLRERCDRHGILLVMDEIQAGFGRTGRMWGHELYDVQPDVVVTAKGLASGFPLSAFAAREEIMGRGLPGSQGGTYGGNAVACAAALATIDVIRDERLVDNAARVGAHLRQRLNDVAREFGCVADVRGAGLMLGAEIHTASGELDGDRALRITTEMERRKVLMLRCGIAGQIVRWLPALIVTQREVDVAVDAFIGALKATA